MILLRLLGFAVSLGLLFVGCLALFSYVNHPRSPWDETRDPKALWLALGAWGLGLEIAREVGNG